MRRMTQETGRILAARLKVFAEDRRGSVTVEAVIMLPLLFWAYCALFSFFDAYRQTSINQKAAYTISDALSRETAPIDDEYLDAMRDMLQFLTRSGSERRLRVSVIRYDANTTTHTVEWSQTRGTVSALSGGDLGTMAHNLPVMVDEERLILVETWTDYVAPFNIGLNDTTIPTFVFTRPRFAPQLLFSA